MAKPTGSKFGRAPVPPEELLEELEEALDDELDELELDELEDELDELELEELEDELEDDEPSTDAWPPHPLSRITAATLNTVIGLFMCDSSLR